MSIGSWLRTHRKKIITHTAIIVGYVLFTIFVVAPLFDRLEALPGEAQLHRLQLPVQTTDIRYEIDVSAGGHSAVDIVGWAFVDGQDSQDRELYVVLKSEQRMYVFDTTVDLRLWLREKAGGLVSNAEYSGFKTLVPARKISNGEYTIGFYIRHSGLEVLHYTDRVVIKSPESVTVAFLTSKQVELTLPPESGSIRFWVRAREDWEQRFVIIEGWAFIEGQSTKDGRTYVILRSDTHTYVFDTIPTFAWGVDRKFGNDYDWDLDYSGFRARIPREQLEDGTYQLGIYIFKGDIEAFRYTDTVVTKS